MLDRIRSSSDQWVDHQFESELFLPIIRFEWKRANILCHCGLPLPFFVIWYSFIQFWVFSLLLEALFNSKCFLWSVISNDKTGLERGWKLIWKLLVTIIVKIVFPYPFVQICFTQRVWWVKSSFSSTRFLSYALRNYCIIMSKRHVHDYKNQWKTLSP